MVTLSEQIIHPCKNCIISMICIKPCDKYYPDISVLNTMNEYKRAMNFALKNGRRIIYDDDKNKIIINDLGVIYYNYNNLIHRDGKPAAIFRSGLLRYYNDGILQRSTKVNDNLSKSLC